MIKDPVEIRLAAELKQFGRYLKFLRTSSGYKTRKEFSYLCGITMRHIERVERGGINLPLELIIQIGRSLNLPAAAFFDYTGKFRTEPGYQQVMRVEDIETEKRKLGERLYQLREDREISLLDVEMEAGISRKRMKEYESGAKDIDFRKLVKFAILLDVELFELFNYDDV